MKISQTLSAAAALTALAGAAHADVKVIQALTIDNPQMKAAMESMSAQQKAMMSRMGVGGTILATVYVSGSKSRTDIGAANSVIVDPAAGRITTLNRIAHTYSTQPYSRLSAQRQGVRATIKPTGRTRVILGHLCRDYHMSVSSAAMPGGGIAGDIWAAPDLPRPAAPTTGGPMAALQGVWSKVVGMPLLTTGTITGSAAGTTTFRMAAKSVSTTPVPASAFSIPAGYNPGPAYGNPMMGGGLPTGG